MKKYLSVIFLITLFSCVYDSTTYKITDYEYAINGKLFEKGWIPNLLINKKMENIYLKTNVDTNNFFFTYNIPRTQIQQLKLNLKPIKKDDIKMPNKNLNLSTKILNEVKNTPEYFLIIEKNDSIKIGLDINKSLLYGWN